MAEKDLAERTAEEVGRAVERSADRAAKRARRAGKFQVDFRPYIEVNVYNGPVGKTVRYYRTTQAGGRSLPARLMSPARPAPARPPSPSRPAVLDDQGKLIPLSDEERAERARRLQETLAFLREDTGPGDPEADAAFFRAVDSHRPEGAKLFEGYY